MKPTEKPNRLRPRPYGKLIKEGAAQAAMTHYHAWCIHRDIFPETKRGARGRAHPMTEGSPLSYVEYAAETTKLPAPYIRDLVRIGKLIPEEFLVSIIGTERDNFMLLLNIAVLVEEFKRD